MTDERKPETPGLSEVSPKFVDEAEAATAAPPSSVSVIEDPVVDEPLLALERRWRAALKAWGVAKPEPKPDELTKLVSNAQEEMAVTPARTIAGVLVKLRLYADLNSRRSSHSAKGAVVSIDQLPLDNLELDQAAVVGAMHDLERLAATTKVAETPPAEDAALFDALAEYDRLTAISQDLERRKEVFRPGIPEAKEADEAFEAAYNETMVAWTRARDSRRRGCHCGAAAPYCSAC